MRTIIIGMIVIFSYSAACAQKIIERSFTVAPKVEINLDFQFADSIKIESWDRAEVELRAKININENENNENFSLKIREEEDILEIASVIKDLKSLAKKKYLIDKDGEAMHVEGECFDIKMYFKLKVPRYSKIQIKTISGNIEIFEVRGDILAKSISGFIDVSLDKDLSVDLNMSSISGSIYSDLAIDYPKNRQEKYLVGQKIRGKLNGGGANIELSTISGEIYLRENKTQFR